MLVEQPPRPLLRV